jgi:MSHA biogenesis protein MshK
MKAATLLLLGAVAGTHALAAPFADPTQPPGASGAAADAVSGQVEGPRLQSVLISPNRRVAVIGGQAVSLGGTYGEARVIRITETEVVLQTGQERRSLLLHPEIQKRMRHPSGRAGTVHKGVGK